MSDLHEAPLLELLRRRFGRGAIYTWAGEVLLSVNPFENIPRLHALPGWTSAVAAAANPSSPAPHIFAVAERAWRSATSAGADVAIIVNGESGAGKTEACRQVLRYVSRCSAECRVARLEAAVLDTACVLEAFGNARTVRNDNSSRFGKLTCLRVARSGASGVVAGCRIKTLLLERSRVATHAPGERSFHIFYWLLEAKGLDPASFTMLNAATEASAEEGGASAASAANNADASKLAAVEAALSALGFSADDIAGVWSTLLGLLELGNVRFAAADQGGDQGGSVVDESAPLERAAAALGIEAGLLETALTQRTHRAAAGRGSIHSIPLAAWEAAEARDALTRHLYQHVFDFLVARLNAHLDPPAKGGEEARSLMLLDIYGFEDVGSNSLEQLLINYANELLQRLFNAHVFEREAALYKAEGIDAAAVSYTSNDAVLALLSAAPCGLLPLLEEQGLLGERGSSDNFALEVFRHHGQSRHVGKPKRLSAKEDGERVFVVRHFAGGISYDSRRFVEKNVEALHGDLHSLLPRLAGYARVVLDTTMPAPATPRWFRARSNSNAASATTAKIRGSFGISSTFRSQANALLETLQSGTPHFVRCLKPNSAQAAADFDSALVLAQLRSLGVLETVRIRREGFPVRTDFAEVWADCALLAPHAAPLPPRERAEAVLERLPAAMWRLGHTKAFLRDGALELLRAEAASLRTGRATAIQAMIRRKRAGSQRAARAEARREELRAVAAVSVQRYARRRAALGQRQALLDQRAAASRAVQAAARRRMAAGEADRRRGARDRQLAALFVQRLARGRMAGRETKQRREARDRQLAALCIQRLARGRSARKLWRSAMLLAQRGQASQRQFRFRAVMASRRQFRHVLKPHELVMMAAVVRRDEYTGKVSLGRCLKVSHRQALVFTSAGRLLCTGVDARSVEWEQEWSPRLSVVMTGGRDFGVTELRAGHRVSIDGVVSRPELNGRKGVAKRFSEATGRFTVSLADPSDRGEEVELPPANLAVRAADAPKDCTKFVELLGAAERWRSIMSHDSEEATQTLIDKASASEACEPSHMLRMQGELTKRSLSGKPGKASDRWQRRWIVLQGRTIYWFKGSEVPKGQLELVEGSRVCEYEQEDAADAALHPFTLLVSTAALRRAGVPGLLLQAPAAEVRAEWIRAVSEALPEEPVGPLADSDPLTASVAGKLPAVFHQATVTGRLHKRALRHSSERWTARWCALHGKTIYWFSGYYKLKGSMELTRGTRLRDLAGSRPGAHAFAVSTPEMERAGLFLGLQASSDAQKREWMNALGAAVESLSAVAQL
ncbi:hypothetical protein EMIHUDRAFT_431051 [Emiliania huxleyi CCMP1516]|uniref:Myosin n=2 Tax=Emiliania huxleyi TaxID=2903 RepID=A0A0D3IV10_EMIH1|nr:hypothetical protein EMIHUDRAFT_431051 [Emiliania huxleyi CCMP1516]EOD15095.1 hypothetical protein EMIHUDRAFT_431051 [Emiliania huxleyi CCMP1516]|eukprot:XP_005767524.1 hypothetical protein EMIHUDRAFT_431051 [Emiliania huxleyi CCMP1516]